MLQALRNRKGEEKGFTLIELMVVILIIAILIAIALPTFLGARTRAQNRSAQSSLRNGLSAAKTHYTDSDTYNGFDATKASSLEGSLTWISGDATAAKQVGISSATGNTVVLTAISESGTAYCIKDIAGGTGAGTFYGSGADVGAAKTACTLTSW